MYLDAGRGRNIQRTVIVFAHCPLVILLGTRVLLNVLIPCEPLSFTPAPHDDAVLSAVIYAEYVWATSVVLLIIVCSGAVVYCGLAILKC